MLSTSSLLVISSLSCIVVGGEVVCGDIHDSYQAHDNVTNITRPHNATIFTRNRAENNISQKLFTLM